MPLLYLYITETAISLSEILYEKAEKTASNMGISQSKLFSIAVEEFIEKHNKQTIMENIDGLANYFGKISLDINLDKLRNR